MKVFSTLALMVALPTVGCTTDKADVANAEMKGDQQTAAAYDKADEKSLAAEDEAAQKSDAAYNEAVKTEEKVDQSVEETRQRAFVQALSATLDRRKTDIKDLKARVSRQRPRANLEAQLVQLDTSEKAAASALAATKSASWDQWRVEGKRAKSAFGRLDQDYAKVSEAAH